MMTRSYQLNRSNPKTLAAAATITFIGVHEFEAFIETFAHKVKLGAVDISHAFRIDQHLDAIVFKHHVFGGDFIGVFKLVSQT